MQRQRLLSDSVAELDRHTNEMLVRNAENVRKNAVDLARQAGSSSIKLYGFPLTKQLTSKKSPHEEHLFTPVDKRMDSAFILQQVKKRAHP